MKFLLLLQPLHLLLVYGVTRSDDVQARVRDAYVHVSLEVAEVILHEDLLLNVR